MTFVMNPRRSPARLVLPSEAHSRLAQFVALVRESPHNLLSARGLDELESRHIPECLGLAGVLPADAHTLIDIGSGGGFPGMPIAIARPDVGVTLLDSTSKKVRFLADASSHLGVPVETIDARAEDAVHARGQSFDVATARAVAPLERLLGWTLPFLRPGGLLYAVKGERWADELRAARALLARIRAEVVDVLEPGQVVSTSPVEAPDGITPRVVIIRAPG